MSDTAPAVHDNRTAFPLATLVARLMLGTFLFLTAMTAGPWLFTRGAGVAFEVVISALPNLLLHLAFVLMLPKGSHWVAGAFGIWCVWGFIDFQAHQTPSLRFSAMPLAFSILLAL